MKKLIDIDVILDDKYSDPRITIYAKEKNELIENIITAVESVTENAFPMIPAYSDDGIELLSQRDIIRIYTQGRKIVIQTTTGNYNINKPLIVLESMLNDDRFIRISQSEIVNLYKVKNFEFSKVGTIGIELENGEKTWASRSRVKAIKEVLKR
jgi:DNA-binding LytR/AlgR family response regulator